MNDLPHLFQAFVNFTPGPLHSSLSQVDGVGQEPTTFFEVAGICAIFNLDALALEELVDVLVKLSFFNRFHSYPILTPKIHDSMNVGNYRTKVEL